jgi:hypothetical protein
MFLRRFDLEHTFRFLKQTVGWTKPRIRTPAAADRWTWLVIGAHTQLRLARHLVGDLRRPWEHSHQIRPAVPGPHPPGVSQHPTGNRHAGQRTETLTARPRPSTRIT